MRRIPGLPPKQWSPTLLAAADALKAPEGFPALPIGSGRHRGMSSLETFAQHPDLAAAFFPFNGHVLYGTTLAPRQRGIILMRLGVLRQSTYLWTQHYLNSLELGLTDADIADIAFGPAAPTLVPLEAAIIRAVDELVADAEISDATWDELATELDHRQLLDLVFTVGCYETVIFMMRTVRLELDPVAMEMLTERRRTTAATTTETTTNGTATT